MDAAPPAAPVDKQTDVARFMVAGGAGCVILGGLVAAITGPLGLENGSWLAAYLVLVCGVGAYAIGTMQARPAPTPMPQAWSLTQLGCWSLANAAVITGAMTGIAIIVDVGVPLLVIALAVALADALRHDRPTESRETAGYPVPGSNRLAAWAYHSLLVVLMISAPVGAVLAHLRNAA
ncbi:hypothetical protein [Actinomycetospora cinnamomea]|uniref:Uncharacterized protein n=1 Tax=Actinomycetospora cinnamomea TaxID=663609 RepID=A0A2U1FAW9_9PSEU|nr:hypothetical protein [Actinomycetospora cinnamomea]PVZ09120.1 hypothetical protein C8D89_107284 [Actinomycetospora cinnamomea]